MTPLRVAAILGDYLPRSVIGAYAATHQFLAALAAAGHDVTVWRTEGKPPKSTPYELDGVTVRPPPGGSVLDESHPFRHVDCIVSHLGRPVVAAAGHRIAYQMGVPSIVIAHSVPDVIRGQLDGAALLVCNSETTRRGVAWEGPTIVCPPPTWPHRHATNPGTLVTQVNVMEAKGGRVFWELTRRLPDVEFLAVAGWGNQLGPDGQDLERHSTPDLPANVTWQSHTSDMRSDVWARTAILLMPSVTEAWGQVAVEAACSGIPTIASDLPGLREALSVAGTFVEPSDVDGWVDALLGLQNPGEWLSASARALGRVAALDPQVSIDRFRVAIEQTVQGATT